MGDLVDIRLVKNGKDMYFRILSVRNIKSFRDILSLLLQTLGFVNGL